MSTHGQATKREFFYHDEKSVDEESLADVR